MRASFFGLSSAKMKTLSVSPESKAGEPIFIGERRIHSKMIIDLNVSIQIREFRLEAEIAQI